MVVVIVVSGGTLEGLSKIRMAFRGTGAVVRGQSSRVIVGLFLMKLLSKLQKGFSLRHQNKWCVVWCEVGLGYSSRVCKVYSQGRGIVVK